MTPEDEWLCRPYQADDRRECLALFDSNTPRYFAAGEAAEFASFLETTPGRYLVITDREGTILACGGYLVNRAKASAGLCWGMVRADCHDRGLGRRLLTERLARIAEEPDIKTVVIDTSQHTAPFYRHFGFVEEDFEKDGYGPGLDRVAMRLDLNGQVPT